MRNTKSVCSKVKPLKIDRKTPDLDQIVKKSEFSEGSFTSNTSLKVTDALSAASMERGFAEIDIVSRRSYSALVPSPGSADCIWRRELHLIAAQQSHINKYKDMPSLSCTNESDAESDNSLDNGVASILEDTRSFPGQVCIALHSMYLAKLFNSDRDTLLHARECLDAIASAVLSIVPLAITSIDTSISERISRAVDRHVLGLSHRAMYCKAFLAAHLINFDNDKKLTCAVQEKRSEMYDSSGSSELLDPCEYCRFVKPILMYTTELLSPRDKLSQFKKALQAISSSLDNHTCTCITKCDILEQPVYRASDPISARDSRAEGDPCSGTDRLLEVVSNVLLSSEHCAVTMTDAKTAEYWFAECTFIELMMREGDWSLGIESYALTTVMQSLNFIIQQQND